MSTISIQHLLWQLQRGTFYYGCTAPKASRIHMANCNCHLLAFVKNYSLQRMHGGVLGHKWGARLLSNEAQIMMYTEETVGV